MEQNIQKCVVAYFKYLAKHNQLSKSVNESCTSTLNRTLAKCRHLALMKKAVQSVNEDENHLRKRLIYSLLLEINDLVCSVMKLTSTLEKSTGELRNKFNEFEQSVKDYDFPENSILTNGNSLQPSLSELLELANDSWTYYEAYIGEIQISLQIANLTKEAEIENILEILKRNLNDNDIDDFIAITQFCEQVDVSTT